METAGLDLTTIFKESALELPKTLVVVRIAQKVPALLYFIEGY